MAEEPSEAPAASATVASEPVQAPAGSGDTKRPGGGRPTDSAGGGSSGDKEGAGQDPARQLEDCREKLKRALADFANLQKKTDVDIRTGVNDRLDRCFLDFLPIYDDFLRAKEAYAASEINTDGLDSILRNMDSFLSKYDVSTIDALGEIFNPAYHEAVSVVSDPGLDDNTITKEIRKGYISHNRVIRPTLVEISKKEA